MQIIKEKRTQDFTTSLQVLVNLMFRAIARLHLQRRLRNSLNVYIVKQLNRNAIVL